MEYSLSSSLVGGSGSLNLDKLSLDLPFAITKSLTAAKGPTPAFVRASTGTYFGNDGYLKSAANNVARFDHETSYAGSTILVQCIDCVDVYSDVFSAAERIPLSGIDVDGYPYFNGSLFTVSYSTSTSEWILSYNGGDFEAYSTSGLSDDYTPYGTIGGSATVTAELACKGLLIEESSANLLSYSEQLDNAYWSSRFNLNTSGTPTWQNLGPAPSGSYAAEKIIPNTSPNFHYIGRTSLGLTVGATYTASVFVKSDGYRYASLSDLVGAGAIFDLQTGVVISSSGTGVGFTPVNIGNGWWRIAYNFTAVTTSGLGIFPLQTSSNIAYAGDNVKGILAWGAQLEAKAFPTSYIQTTSGTAPRSADLCSITSSAFTSFYNQPEGTILSSSSMPVIPSTVSLAYAFDNATEQERHNLRHNTSFFVTQVSGVTQAQFSGTAPTAGSVTKFAAAYKVADYAATKNGSLISPTVSPFTSVPTPTQVYIGSKRGTLDFLNGHVQYIKVFKKRLTNAKLQSLTT